MGPLTRIEGREEEVLTLRGRRVHPNVFHAVLETLPVAGWQIVDEGGRLRVLLVHPAPGADPHAVGVSVATALASVGVPGGPIAVQVVDAIPRTALGKVSLVRRAQPSADGDRAPHPQVAGAP